jgi:hypothetical protein
MGKRNGKATGFEGIVTSVRDAFAEELEDALPELDQAVKAGGGEGSFSCTLQIKPCKRTAGFLATLTSRVRAPRKPRPFDLRIGDEGQLELGFDPTPRDEGQGDGEHEGAAAH